MSDTITYTVDDETITFQYPMLTVTQVPVIAGRGDFAISVRKIYAVRAIVFADVPFENLDTAISWMHQILSAPGGRLVIDYADWGTELTIDPATYPDLKGGPHPRIVEITKIYGSRAAMVHWEVEVELFPTPAGYVGVIAKWVDFVYTINTTIDKNFYATRTIGGFLRLNKAFTAQQQFSADSFRHTISNYFRVPDISRGFWQRESQVFKVNEDDTILRFTLVDKQVYSWLPQHITSGDLSVTTATTRTDEEGVTSTLTLDGFLQSTDFAHRAFVQGVVQEILNMFATRVLYTIQQETLSGVKDKRFWVRERSFAFVHHWRSNRVDFNLHWEVKGQFEGGLTPNAEYTTGVVLQWLAELTNEKSVQPDESDFGTYPYGTSFAAGATGRDFIASPIEINFDDKMTASRAPGYWNIPEYGDRSDTSKGGVYTPRQESAESSDNITFHQRFEYKLDTGVRHTAILAVGYDDVRQQIHNPRLFLIITGEAERWDAPPLAPRPPYPLAANSSAGGDAIVDSPYATLLSMNIKPKEPTGDGKYRLEWQYVLSIHNLTIPDNLDVTALALKWPSTPNYTQANENWSFPL